MEHFDALRAMQALAEVSDDAVRWLADHVTAERFDAGDTLITEGGLDRDCWFIVAGETEVTAAGLRLGRTGAGDPEGEMALFFNRARSCTTVALGFVDTLRLRADDFDRLRREEPSIAADLQQGVLRHLARRFGTS